ncbi:nucleotide triphosphate diphosphatase NUDT15 [Patella vulgata]|uniref:nucleotide triphosphate diphosphatase NUDT15 n=1 Tax=Patella vulgata TaxID=6465 RepID=UPI002180443E|nr:nucleotide triphosphate diphosphatase NUDT15 [Patella vulgata]
MAETGVDERKQLPNTGVGVIVTHPDYPNRVLLGIRKGSTGEGLYAFPVGHLKFGEYWEDCGIRETLKETGLKLKNVFYATVVNAIEEQVEKYHYVTLLIVQEVDASYKQCKQETENLEPKKCSEWQWVDWDDFPPLSKLFYGLRILREENEYNPFKKKSG